MAALLLHFCVVSIFLCLANGMPATKYESPGETEGGARLPLPGPLPIDLEQIRKLGSLLAVIGEQIIPSILDAKNADTGSEKLNPPTGIIAALRRDIEMMNK